jgi:hypothetical protein
MTKNGSALIGELLCAPLRLFAYFAVKKPLKQLTAKSAKNAKIAQRVEHTTIEKQLSLRVSSVAASHHALPPDK